MRKIFGGAMLASAIGSVVLGGALAWNQSVTITNQTADVGTLSFTAEFTPSENGLLGPNGATSTVGTFGVTNDGDFNLGFSSGVVVVKDFGSLEANHASCDVANFSGKVTPIGEIGGQGLAPGETAETAGRVEITIATAAPVACAGGTVTYDVIITLQTLPNA